MSSRHYRTAFFAAAALLTVLIGFGGPMLSDYRALRGKVTELQTELNAALAGRANTLSFFLNDASSTASVLQAVNDLRSQYVRDKKSFLVADLQAMTIVAYDHGTATATYPILTKGREGSWWETASGNYSVLSKEQNHFSSIGKVWMPWSIQFYGNFFIHGWPYYDNGEPVGQGYSGGCIRLSTDDAAKVFAFASRGTPILVLDDDRGPGGPKNILAAEQSVPIPQISGHSFLVADLSAGSVLAEREAETPLPIASLAKLMTGVVASELIYLERDVTITPAMLTATVQSYPFKLGDRFTAFDLLYPLLMQSSNGAASAIASYIGEQTFVANMNAKAASLEMYDTTFVDPAGIGEGNISSAKDLLRLTGYILAKRQFLFDMGRGKNFLNFGPSRLGGLQNFNEYAADPRLVGMKNGETAAAKQTILSVWHLSSKGGSASGGTDASGDARTILMIVLGSDNRVADTDALLAWVKASFGLQ